MIKLVNKNNVKDIWYFEDDVDHSEFLNTDDYREMTSSEIEQHENPTQTADEKRAQMAVLTRYQFLRCMLENGYKASDIEAQILMINDEMTRELTLLEFKEATNFVRTDSSISIMRDMLNFTDEKIDEMWNQALTY